MESLILSAIYSIIIIGLVAVRVYQKKHIRVKNNYMSAKAASNVDLQQMKNNYEILTRMLDNMEKETKHDETKQCQKKVS